MNKIIIVGYMAKNPEQITTKNGNTITKFRVSAKKDRRVNEGESKYNYFDCIAFDKTGEYIYKYANSQSRIAIEGTMENTSWTAQDGSKRYSNQINVKSADIVSSTVNQGDFQQPQGDPLAQYQQGGGVFAEVDDPDLPFI